MTDALGPGQRADAGLGPAVMNAPWVHAEAAEEAERRRGVAPAAEPLCGIDG